MFTTLIVQPIFNLLVLIEAILPGHNFGLAIIIFTIVVRLLMWPLVKKQLKQAKAMRELQPEVKRIKQAAKGDKRREQQLTMELYKEREVSPFGSIGTLIVQLVILIGLYSGLHRVVYDPQQLVTFSYPFLRHLPWLQDLSTNIHHFHSTLFGIVDLNRAALSNGGVYIPAMIIVVGSAITQYFQSKQLMPSSGEGRKLRDILKSAGSGTQTDQAEINAAVGKSTRYFLPVMVFLFTINYPSALSLYWLVGGLVAYIQQSIILREDATKMDNSVTTTKDVRTIAEAEVVATDKTPKKTKKKTSAAKNKRRKK